MKCTICIGSSCHLKGSRQIVEELQYLVKENNLEDKVELAARSAWATVSTASTLRWMTSCSPSPPRPPRNSSRKRSWLK